jgi:tetratricopeptide (TPR) repeat protein
VAGWALWIYQRPIPTTDPAAIEATAEAATHEAFAEFQEAADRYTDAIDLDDDFRPAYTGRSTTAFLTANPDFTRTLAVVDAEGELATQALADAEEAIRLGQGKDFGSLLVSGLYRFYAGDYDGAVERLEDATEINDQAPEAFLLLTAGELALGDTAAADVALDDAIGLLDLQEASDANREFAAILFTLLEQVEAAVPDRAADVEAIRNRLAVGEAELVFGVELTGETASEATFSLDRAELVDGDLESTLGYEGLPDGSLVSIYVYEQPAVGAAFAQATELARFAPLDGSGTISGTTELERACQPVALRYDVYVDGAPAASLDAPGAEPTC